MKKLLPLFALIAVLSITSCQSGSSNNDVSGVSEIREKTAEEIKAELAQKEMQSPEVYLKASGRFHGNLIGETVLEGRIDNTATIASFKDIVVEATFLAASGTTLGSKEFTRYEILSPGYGCTFKFKTFAPDQTKSVGVRVVNATPVQ